MNSDHDISEIERRAGSIKLLLMDCDGVLTDGRLELLENGDEQKTFHAGTVRASRSFTGPA